MSKIDFKKVLKHLYSASAKQPTLVDVPTLNYLSIDGAGDPNTSSEYQQAVQALFSLAYTIKFAIKKGAAATDYAVMPLQGQWWVDDMSQFSVARKDEWKWTLMIMQPPPVTEPLVQACREKLAKKDLVALAKVEFAAFAEGKAAQILHIGPFSEEGPTIARLHRFIEESDASLAGKHHEIYLSDIRRAAPAKWKTIIRQPLKK
ncbi:GyrI-like domain-containing protein [Steroidobacter sp. S1-65]|uniref:GyrI-like domain-containing protein n=1 Tax=Steroidobacter gossypii TaxID=2805490 RepID=A0ABS1WWR3_9GAMM|nr:GyrI-like domain-containing protein [Steroidobacter gossypii]MBM0105426.1 GyrI-like domain-containing protein [Steroidobacter gossypii]